MKPDHNTTTITSACISLLKASLGQKDSLRSFSPLSPKEWHELYRYAHRQGILTWMIDGIAPLTPELMPPKEIRMMFIKAALECEENSAHYRQTLNTLRNLLEGKVNEAIILKGLTLAQYYPHPDRRYAGDIDLYIPHEAERVSQLLTAGGIELVRIDPKHAVGTLNQVLIELHYTLLDTKETNADKAQLACYLTEQIEKVLTNEPTQSFESPFKQLPPMATLYLLTCHLAMHIGERNVMHRQLVDIALFLRAHRQQLDLQHYLKVLRHKRIHRLGHYLIGYADQILNLGLPIELYGKNYKRSARLMDELLAMNYKNRRNTAEQRTSADRIHRFLISNEAHQFAFGHNRLSGRLVNHLRQTLRRQTD